MYAPYSYYYEAYHGSQLTPDQWPAAALEAEAYIDLLTFGRLKNGAPVTLSLIHIFFRFGRCGHLSPELCD